MSRGTRVGGDVMGLMPEEDPYEPPFPHLFALPAGSPHLIGRVGILNDKLIVLHNEIRDLGNEIYDKERQAAKCTYLTLGKYAFNVGKSFSDRAYELWVEQKQACRTAMNIVSEIEALGYKAYIPPALRNLVHRRNTVPFGSMGYLIRTPHYFSPEEYFVPNALPFGDEFIIRNIPNIRTVGDANSFLRYKFSAIARGLNRVRFLRDCCVRRRARAGTALHKDLTGQIMACRREFDLAISVIKTWQNSPSASQVFTMPVPLRDLVMADNAIITQNHLGEVACLFPGGIHSIGGMEMYLLYESALGYAIFRVCALDVVEQRSVEARAAVVDWESFSQAVKLTVYYPFPSEVHALNQCRAISQGIMTPELNSILKLYLPDPEGWKEFRLGVDHPVLANYIRKETRIVCQANGFVCELQRGIRLYFNRFVELEDLDVEKAQRRLAWGIQQEV